MQRRLIPVVLPLLALLVAGCASVKVTDRDEYRGATLPRPERILVLDFVAAAEDLPQWVEARTRFASPKASLSDEERQLGRRLGAAVARELVADIQEMGLPARQGDPRTSPREGDIVLVGCFTSIDEGSTAKRLIFGFGSGAAEMRTHVEGYRMVDGRLEKLGSGSTEAGASKAPGIVVPVLVTVATANPIGLLVMTPVKAAGEISGRNRIDGTAERTADKIARVLEDKFREQGWL